MLKKIVEELTTYDMQDAYSFDEIGWIAGDAMLKAAKDAGFNDKQAEEIFRSKHARWFYNNVEDKVADFVGKLFSDYIKKNKNGIMDIMKGKE